MVGIYHKGHDLESTEISWKYNTIIWIYKVPQPIEILYPYMNIYKVLHGTEISRKLQYINMNWVFQTTEISRKIQYPYMNILSAVGHWNIQKRPRSLCEYIESCKALKYPWKCRIPIWIYQILQGTEISWKVPYPYVNILSLLGHWNILKSKISSFEYIKSLRVEKYPKNEISPFVNIYVKSLKELEWPQKM